MPAGKMYKAPIPTKSQVKAIVKKAIKSEQETKEFDISASTLGITSVGYGSSGATKYLVNTIVSGNTDGTRIGNEIYIQNVRYQFTLAPGDTTNWFRLLLIVPKRAGGYNYSNTVAQLLQEALSEASSATQYCGLVDTDHFQVLLDKLIFLEYVPDTGSTAAVHAVGKLIRGNVKVNRKFTWAYNGVAGSDVPTSELIMVACSDSAAVAHPGAVAGKMRIYYKDS